MTADPEKMSAAGARRHLGLSRRAFEKLVREGAIPERRDGSRKVYLRPELNAFKATEAWKAAAQGVVDRRNTLNDLTGKEWLPETKSYMYQKGLGADSPEAEIEKLHPAPFSFQDAGRLVRFFTKEGMRVLDPFGGVGSTAKACEVSGRVCTSIELSPRWHSLAVERLEKETGEGASRRHELINADCREALGRMEAETFDFVVTSPPYWGILHKKDQKVRKNRVAKGLETSYSDDERDLGNIAGYGEFLDVLTEILLECGRVLRTGKYMAVIVSDFRNGSDFVSFHSDLIGRLGGSQTPGGGWLRLQGTKILVQSHKSLLPYGYPFAYVENIHHQYILIFRKEK